MVRILQDVGSMNRGGLETLIMNIYRNIDRTKIQFDFLYNTMEKTDYDDEIESLGGRIYRTCCRRDGIFRYRKELNEFYKKHTEYKVVHKHLSSLTDVESLRFATKYGIGKRIVHIHNTKEGGSRLHKYLHMINQFGLEKYANRYFACSDSAALWLSRKLYKNDKCVIINNAIECKKFEFSAESRMEIRKKHNIDDKFVVGHVGRFMPQKNHSFLVDIFVEILKLKKDSILLLVGEGVDREKIEEKVKRLGIEENVIFAGKVTNVNDYMNAMDVFVMPSLHEGLPVVLVEAQAAGLEMYVPTDVVPKKTDMTGLITFVDLQNDAKTWAKIVIDNFKENDRYGYVSMLKDNNFDASNVARQLEKIYIQE